MAAAQAAEREGASAVTIVDSQSVARPAVLAYLVRHLKQMSIENGVWKLWRDEAGFSPLDFFQRYTGSFSDDGKTIAGAWEICHNGKIWEHDFDLSYIKA